LSTSVRGWWWWKLLTWLLGTSQISRWLVRVTGADAPGVEGAAPLPRRAAHGFVSHDHTVPALTVDLADPLDDPAPPPLTTDTHHTAAWRAAVRRSFQAMPGFARRASGTGLLTMPSMRTCVRKVECWLGPSPYDSRLDSGSAESCATAGSAGMNHMLLANRESVGGDPCLHSVDLDRGAALAGWS
jgi:hypothetical protein